MPALKFRPAIMTAAACLTFSVLAQAPASAAPSPAPATVSADHPCGNHLHSELGQANRYWKNCISKSETINIDRIFAWDQKICVKAGSDTYLGSATDTRGASRVGDC